MTLSSTWSYLSLASLVSLFSECNGGEISTPPTSFPLYTPPPLFSLACSFVHCCFSLSQSLTYVLPPCLYSAELYPFLSHFLRLSLLCLFRLFPISPFLFYFFFFSASHDILNCGGFSLLQPLHACIFFLSAFYLVSPVNVCAYASLMQLYSNGHSHSDRKLSLN